MKRLLQRWFAIGFVGMSGVIGGCNLSDPVGSLPRDGCVDEGDCDDHGSCSVQKGIGTCVCNVGYTGDTCGECESGYVEQAGSCVFEAPDNSTTNNTATNNTTTTCSDDQVLVDGSCVSDSCADTPCGLGDCTVTGEGTWSCSCPDGSTGTECLGCADDCVNGTCDADEMCVCDRGWAGATCETCAPGFTGAACDMCASNAFGPNCDTCASLTTGEPWWDRNYAGRQGLVVFNPASSARSILGGVAVDYAFPHDMLVANGGADPDGLDLRVISPPDRDLDRILGFDSGWSLPNTTIWFPTTGDILPNDFDVFFVYSRNTMPANPRENAANVLRQDRSWYHGPGGPAYSAQPLNAGQYSLQLRQKSPGTMQIYFHDSGNDITAVAQLRMFDTTTGAQVQDLSYGSSRGSSAVPANIFDEVTGLPNNLRVDFLINAGDGAANETAAIFLGSQQVLTGETTLTYQATLTRAVNATAAPNVFVCPSETVPP